VTAASSGTHTRWCRKQASSLALSSAPVVAGRASSLAPWRTLNRMCRYRRGAAEIPVGVSVTERLAVGLCGGVFGCASCCVADWVWFLELSACTKERSTGQVRVREWRDAALFEFGFLLLLCFAAVLLVRRRVRYNLPLCQSFSCVFCGDCFARRSPSHASRLVRESAACRCARVSVVFGVCFVIVLGALSRGSGSQRRPSCRCRSWHAPECRGRRAQSVCSPPESVRAARSQPRKCP